MFVNLTDSDGLRATFRTRKAGLAGASLCFSLGLGARFGLLAKILIDNKILVFI